MDYFWELSYEALLAELEGLGIAPSQRRMRAAQIWRGAYIDGIADWMEVTTLSKEFRERLSGRFSLTRPKIERALSSQDGTRKWLLKMSDGGLIETVFIPEKDRGTLCLSSQIGCALSCHFCYTGTQRWQRNLSSGEMVSQIILALDEVSGWDQTKNRKITNIVMMGQGEPLLNLPALLAAIEIFCDGDGLAFSRRKVTVSTAGIVPAIERLGEAARVRLAISLHAPDDERRTRLIPLNKKYNLSCLLEACRSYVERCNGQRITFEYVMLDGINDSAEDAVALARLLRGIPSKVNLIPFNPWPGSNFRTSRYGAIARFAQIMQDKGYTTPIRRARGADIMAACGQLKSEV